MTTNDPAIAGEGLRSRIIDHIVRGIAGGDWRPGDLVPAERELMAMFGASRMTVHNALRELVNRGFLVRRRGAGSFVAPPRPYASHYAHQDIVEEIEAQGGHHSAQILHQAGRAPEAHEAEAFGSDAPVFHAIVLHSKDGVPVELEDRLLDPVAVPASSVLNLERKSLFSALMLARPYREGDETIRPIIPSAKERKLLKIGKDEPALEITRRTYVQSKVITLVRLIRVGEFATLRGHISSMPVPVDSG